MLGEVGNARKFSQQKRENGEFKELEVDHAAEAFMRRVRGKCKI